MLPGFRFLFTAVILSVSVLIFGLGAAALLRAAHEEFANLPSRRLAPEPVFARLGDSSMLTLSLLRVDPPAAEKPETDVLDIATADVAVAPTEQAPEIAPAEPEKLASLKPEEPASAESATADASVPAAIAETPAAPADTVTPIADPDVKFAAIAETPAAPAPSPAEPPSDVFRLDDNAAATRIATLGSPAVIVDPTGAKPDRSTIRTRSAQRAQERRRLAARRARLAREALASQQRIQQENNPFAPALLGRPIR